MTPEGTRQGVPGHENRVREALSLPNTGVVFDVDGTLTDYAYGCEHALDELDFVDRAAADAVNIYDCTCRRLETMAAYIDRIGIDRVSCLSTEATGRGEWKREMLLRNYGIPAERVVFVERSEDKPRALRAIAETLLAGAERIVYVDDSIETLSLIQRETDVLTFFIGRKPPPLGVRRNAGESGSFFGMGLDLSGVVRYYSVCVL